MPSWFLCERVPNAELGAWEADKHAGAGRDRRLGAPALVVMSLCGALASFRPRGLKNLTGWPHEGPRSTLEVLQLIHGLLSPRSVTATIRGSLRSGSVLEHKLLYQILGLAVQRDRLDVTIVASVEMVTRRLVMIERAVKLNLKAPSCAGLHRMVDHALSEGGGVTTKNFTAHMAEIAEREARILRLLREEIGSQVQGGRREQEAGQRNGGRQRVTRNMMWCAPAAEDSRRRAKLPGKASRCSREVLPLPVKLGRSCPGHLVREGAHDALGNCVMQELGLAEG